LAVGCWLDQCLKTPAAFLSVCFGAFFCKLGRLSSLALFYHKLKIFVKQKNAFFYIFFALQNRPQKAWQRVQSRLRIGSTAGLEAGTKQA